MARQDTLARLSEAVLDATRGASSMSEATQVVVDLVCKQMDWPVGHAFVRSPGGATMADTGVWHLDDPVRMEGLVRVTKGIRCPADTGTVGSVMMSGEALWLKEIAGQPGFVRSMTAHVVGLKSAMFFPVLSPQEAVGVLEFFSYETLDPDPAMIEVMVQVGRQLGSVLARTQGDDPTP